MTDHLVEQVSRLAERELLRALCMKELHRYIRAKGRINGAYFHDTWAFRHWCELEDDRMDEWGVKWALRMMNEIAADKRRLPDVGDYQ